MQSFARTCQRVTWEGAFGFGEPSWGAKGCEGGGVGTFFVGVRLCEGGSVRLYDTHDYVLSLFHYTVNDVR